MNLVRLAVLRPITAMMLLVSILVTGLIAFERLPLAFLPEVDVPFIVVSIPRPNSSPQAVEEELTEPVEEALATLSGIKELRSDSDADGAVLFLEFDWGQELDVVRMQVSEKIDIVRPTLPADAQLVTVSSFNTADIPVVQARLSAEGVDLSESYPLLEAHVLDPIRRLPGVARVDLDGVMPRQVYVDLIQDRLEEHRIEIGQLAERLQRASVELVLGTVDDGGSRYAVRGLGSFESLEDLRSMPIGVADLSLGDIAEVTYEEPPIGYGRHLGREQAIGLSVFKESTANTVEVVDAVMATIEQDIDADPRLQGIELFVWENQADEIRAGVDGLRRAGLIGALMAVLCLYGFLRRIDSTLIVAMSIPFSIIAACAVLYFLGKTLNLLSMMGLMLGIGMLVDNAIVVLESIDRQRDTESDPRQAALKGAKSVTGAVTSATATTLIVFLPLVLGGATELTVWLKEVGMTISLALVCSLLSSLTLIPLVSTRLLRARKPRVAAAVPSSTEGVYGRVLRWTFAHPWWSALMLIGVLGGGIAPLATGQVPAQPFSARVNERLELRYEFKDFHYKSQAEAVVKDVEAYLFAEADALQIDEVYSFFAENRAGTSIVLTRSDLDDDAVKALRSKIRNGLPPTPGVTVRFWEDAQAGGDSTYFSVQLYGRSVETLEALTQDSAEAIASVTGIEDLSTSFVHGRDEIEVVVDRERAGRRGITAQDAAEAFGFTLGGMPLPRFRDGTREVDTSLALRIEDRASLDDLQGITFPVSDGPSVRLGEIAEFATVSTPQTIERENRQTNAWVRATYEGEDWDAARERIADAMNDLSLPSGYQWSWDKRTLERDAQSEQMQINFLLALALVYIVLASQFESLAQPLAIVLAIVFAVPGAAVALLVTGTPLNLMAQIGLLILMGIVVNNGVVLLDRVNQLRAEGMDAREAFVAAGRDRLRPIAMTATTTILGLLPLALGGSAVGGLFYYPLARTVMGGLASSAVLTLVGLPLLTLGVEAAAAWLSRVWRRSEVEA